ncbi:putative GNAT family N-acyltransferase [Streptomyces turgidiscabies]|uniref:GNAT family N-acyltransferase n=1 Tax=Streptomyces turgidiscabies TaxID=85558 RepID=A0ABU0RI35_9ACTN|nr:putative GNAT family N-acyltransferase [Streptomyces turgidiscabies]
MTPLTPPPYVVRVAEDPADREACFALRKEVFVVEQRVPEDLEYDEFDAVALHVLAVREDGVALGTGRLLYGEAAAGRTGGDLSVGALGRLAVRKESRGLRVGVALVREIEEAARGLGLVAVDLHAQTAVAGFYERLGYAGYGDEFWEAGIAHLAMRRSF